MLARSFTISRLQASRAHRLARSPKGPRGAILDVVQSPGAVQTDEELMAAYVAGDAAAFDELFRRYAPLLLPALRRGLFRDDAAELLQQTFLQIHRSRHDFQVGKLVRPWFFTIALNVKRQHLRTLRRRKEAAAGPEIEDIAVSELAPPEEGSIASALGTSVPEMFSELSREQREVLELHFVEGLPFARVAERVGASVSAVKVRAHRAYLHLRARFGARFRESGEKE